MLHISIDSQNFERGMAQLLHNVENRRPITASLATELLSMTEDNFASESWGGTSVEAKPTRPTRTRKNATKKRTTRRQLKHPIH